MLDLLTAPVPHDQAAKFIAEKPILARAAFDQLLPELRARAFVITGVESANIVQAVRDMIAELPKGGDWDTIKQDVAQTLSPWLDAGAEEKAGEEAPDTLSASQRRAELLLRTHGFQAYSAAQYEVNTRQSAAFPYWQYLTMEDDRVRDTHAVLDQLVLPADSPFWADHYPPWDWGCRCQVVPLQEDDVADIEDQDAEKPAEEQRVLDEHRQKELETTGMLTRALPGANGLPQRFDMRSPEQRGGSYSFKPGSLKMNADDLRSRYDAETWSNFETWAKGQKLETGETVWDWLNSKAPAPVPQPRPTPAARRVTKPKPQVSPVPITPPAPAAPAAAPTIVPPTRSAPVSNALQLRASGSQVADVQRAIAAVDQVHDDGALPKIPIIDRTGSALGIYQFDRIGNAIQIGIREGDWPAMTTAHEIGHFLDHQVLFEKGVFASAKSPEFAAFRDAVAKSEAVQAIENLPRRMHGVFLEPYELWARAYAQYIAVKSRDPIMLEQLNKIRSGLQPWRQWSDQDFAPVEKAIDAIFRAKGWLK